MLVAEIARYLNMSPLRVEGLLERTEEGVSRILQWVNIANPILYDIVIPRLFRTLYDIEKLEGQKHVIRKLLVKDPPDGEEGYEVRVDPARFAEESAPEYRPFSGRASTSRATASIPSPSTISSASTCRTRRSRTSGLRAC